MVIEKKLTKEERNVLDAVRQDNFRDVKILIHTLKKKSKKSELGELNFQYDHGRTLLHAAAETGSKQMAEVLLGSGANSHMSDSNGFLPVHVACELAHSEILRYLVETYPDEINRKTAVGDTLLHLAVSGNHCTPLDIKMLVEASNNDSLLYHPY
ncbi:protein phosphatase 1 regulatory subunit 27-like [Convolutriloba macropyga]|uniref:protein phosphatase 1 regulatory subunit 27-like n=1 Tax=Convolutriloba macropyga TaxID=536237 RepID=UPI003F5210EA